MEQSIVVLLKASVTLRVDYYRNLGNLAMGEWPVCISNVDEAAFILPGNKKHCLLKDHGLRYV